MRERTGRTTSKGRAASMTKLRDSRSSRSHCCAERRRRWVERTRSGSLLSLPAPSDDTGERSIPAAALLGLHRGI